MNRIIKFRLRIDDKIVGYEKWYCGVKETEDSKLSAKPQWLYSTDNKYWNPDYIYHNQKDQFTGLKDKKGKEIYEGDILANKSEVILGNEFGHLTIKRLNTIFHEIRKPEELEVIGNIYENKELIKIKVGKYVKTT